MYMYNVYYCLCFSFINCNKWLWPILVVKLTMNSWQNLKMRMPGHYSEVFPLIPNTKAENRLMLRTIDLGYMRAQVLGTKRAFQDNGWLTTPTLKEKNYMFCWKYQNHILLFFSNTWTNFLLFEIVSLFISIYVLNLQKHLTLNASSNNMCFYLSRLIMFAYQWLWRKIRQNSMNNSWLIFEWKVTLSYQRAECLQAEFLCWDV